MPPKPLRFFSASAEDQRVKNKAAGMWKCIGKSPDSVAGHLYHFKLKEKYDRYRKPYSRTVREAIYQKETRLYPALESNFGFPTLVQQDFTKDNWFKATISGLLEQDIKGHAWHRAGKIETGTFYINNILTDELKRDIAQLDTNMVFFKLIKKIYNICLSAYDEGRISFEQINDKIPTARQYDSLLQKNQLYRQLGYSSQVETDGSLTLTLPNRRALLTRWAVYRRTHLHMELPKIDIQNQKGIASDIGFISCFLTHDALLSTGGEFLHDHLFHVVNLMMLIFDKNQEGLSAAEKYYKEKTRIRCVIYKATETIERAKLALQSGGWHLNGAESSENTEKLPVRINIQDVLAIEMALAIITDALASYISYDKDAPFALSLYNQDSLDDNIPALWDDKSNQDLWIKRWAASEHPHPVPKPSNVRWIWTSIQALESQEPILSSLSIEEEKDSLTGLTG